MPSFTRKKRSTHEELLAVILVCAVMHCMKRMRRGTDIRIYRSCDFQGICRALYGNQGFEFKRNSRKLFVTDTVIACTKQALNVIQARYFSDKSDAVLAEMMDGITKDYLIRVMQDHATWPKILGSNEKGAKVGAPNSEELKEVEATLGSVFTWGDIDGRDERIVAGTEMYPALQLVGDDTTSRVDRAWRGLRCALVAGPNSSTAANAAESGVVANLLKAGRKYLCAGSKTNFAPLVLHLPSRTASRAGESSAAAQPPLSQLCHQHCFQCRCLQVGRRRRRLNRTATASGAARVSAQRLMYGG